METPAFDLAVIGAGPSGSSCAITAARAGARVLLLEKDHFPRHKVCGEFVSAESLQLLEWLLGTAQFPQAPKINTSRIFSGKKMVHLPISPAAQSIPRFDLDMALLQAARQSGVQAEEGVTVREVTRPDLFHVWTADKTFVARVVVNATGRWSQLTQYSPQGEKWIGVKGHFRETAPPMSVDLYFFPGGYCGVQPVGPDAVNACAMVRASVARSLDEVFEKHPELCRRSRNWEPLFSPITTSPLYFRKAQTEGNAMLMAGDSASFVDPFAGDGISLALHSGALAAQSLQPFFQGQATLDQARRQYRANYVNRFVRVFRNAALVRRFFTMPVLVSSTLLGLAGRPSVAAFLVRSTRVRTT